MRSSTRSYGSWLIINCLTLSLRPSCEMRNMFSHNTFGIKQIQSMCGFIVALFLSLRSRHEWRSAARAAPRTNCLHLARSRETRMTVSMFPPIHFPMLPLCDVFGLPRLRFPLTFPWITHFTSSHPPSRIVCPKKESLRHTTNPRSCLVVLSSLRYLEYFVLYPARSNWLVTSNFISCHLKMQHHICHKCIVQQTFKLFCMKQLNWLCGCGNHRYFWQTRWDNCTCKVSIQFNSK